MNILFVCTGNTCRSPMAEGYLKSKNLKDISVASAGIFTDGSPVSENSAAVMKEVGVDISGYTSRPITATMIKAANKIFCMSPDHLSTLKSVGVDESKLQLLDDEITDPFGSDIDEYRRCRDLIIAAIDSIFPDIHIRVAKMNDSDFKKIAELERLCFSSPWSENALKESAEAGTKFLIAEFKGETAGYMGFYTVKDEGYITNIAVLPEYRRKGIATTFLSRLEGFAKENELSFITLEVRASNSAARKLYEHQGFKAEGCRKNFYDNPKEDAVIYTKRF